MINLLGYIIDYAGKNVRLGDLFYNKDWLIKMGYKVKKILESVPNVFT